ncbi:MAG: magnesium transporter [Acholeplasmataceae bacterium]|nr:magnesium transporter [Acholeplasmataceae bacterium]
MLEPYKSLNETEKIKYLESLHGYDLSQLYNELDESEQEEFFELLSSESKAELLTYIKPSEAGEILEELEHEEVGEIISLMEPDDITDIALEVDDELVDEWIQHLDEEIKEDIETLREYEEDEAGAWMSTNIITLHPWMDVKDAMKVLIKEAPDVETIQTLFVVDKNEVFLGIVPLKTLIKAKSPLSIENLYIASTFVFDHDDIDDVTMIIQEEGIYQMPVLNENHELLGMITVDDAIDIYEEEAIEDVQKLTGLFGLLDTTLVKSAFSRLPWLLLLLVLSLPIALVMSGFEHIISKYTILIAFQPLILAVAGNFGTQSISTSLIVINQEYDTPYKTHIKEELISSIYIGLAIGVVGFIISLLFITINPSLSENPLLFASVIGITLFLLMIITSLFSTIVPKLFKNLGFDPANASGPFIATLIDVLAIVLYYGLAILFVEVFL